MKDLTRYFSILDDSESHCISFFDLFGVRFLVGAAFFASLVNRGKNPDHFILKRLCVISPDYAGKYREILFTYIQFWGFGTFLSFWTTRRNRPHSKGL